MKLYPIMFLGGQFGTSLAYFISQHKGFHHWPKEIDSLEGEMFTGFNAVGHWEPRTESAADYITSNADFNYTTDIKKASCKLNDLHHEIDIIPPIDIGDTVFPILVYPESELNNLNEARRPPNAKLPPNINDILPWRTEYGEGWVNLKTDGTWRNYPWSEDPSSTTWGVKQFNKNISFLDKHNKVNGKDYHIVHITKLYRGDPDEYNDLLTFIDTPSLNATEELESIATFLGFIK